MKSQSERVNDRYRLKIRPSNLAGSIRQPTPNERTLFVPRFPLPPIEAQVASGKWNLLESSTEHPSLFLFWGQNSASEQALQQLNRFVDEVERTKVAVVTVFTGSDLRPEEQWKYLENFAENSPEIKQLDFAFRRWTRSDEDRLRSLVW